MKLRNKLLLLAALAIVAIPLLMTGTAMAFQYDGAKHDASTTGWLVPSPTNTFDYGTCEDGTSTNVEQCVESHNYTAQDQSTCTGNGHKWDTHHGWCSVSLDGQTRDQRTCEANGGTWTGQPVCVAAWSWNQTYTESHDLCLRCHSSVSQERSEKSYWKDSYVRTGHKNMLRQVTANQPWEGPDGAVYATDSAGGGRTIDWATGTISSTSYTGSRQLYYIYGDWIAGGPSVVYDSTTPGPTAGYAKYSCASCHTTGYVATNFYTGTLTEGNPAEPHNTYPSLNSGITGSWEFNGIICTRCHQVKRDGSTWARDHHSGSNTTDSNGSMYPWEGQLTLAICATCHGNKDLTVAGNSVSGGKFSSHQVEAEFLNSPHGQFAFTTTTADYLALGNQANYGSHFKGYQDGACSTTDTSVTTDDLEEWNTKTVCTNNGGSWTSGTQQGSCVVCHDVHNSLVVTGQEGLRRECGISCHADKSDWAKLNHPTGTGTPVEDENVKTEGCVVCHMALYAGQSQTPHLFRINPSATYSTFTTNNVNTEPQGSYTKAAWIDVDLACGQCHGGSAGSGATKNSAPYMDKTTLAGYAGSIHNGVPTVVAPTPSIAGHVAYDSLSADSCFVLSVTDTSTPGGSAKLSSVTFNWGDGTASTVLTGGSIGGVASHTYLKAGSYTVTQTATDNDGGTASVQYYASGTAPQILGHVYKSDTTTGVGGAMVWVERWNCAATAKLNTYLVGTNASGAYQFKNILPGTYKNLKATKGGYTFPAPTNTINTDGSPTDIIAITP
jgi:hypothetical protein